MEKNQELILIPKYKAYIQYTIETILRLPRTEKFSIGNDYKQIMYETLRNILWLSKIDNSKRLYYINIIDADLNVQRIYLRIMHENKWINDKRFYTAIDMISEIGKIIGGLLKYYGTNIKK